MPRPHRHLSSSTHKPFRLAVASGGQSPAEARYEHVQRGGNWFAPTRSPSSLASRSRRRDGSVDRLLPSPTPPAASARRRPARDMRRRSRRERPAHASTSPVMTECSHCGSTPDANPGSTAARSPRAPAHIKGIGWEGVARGTVGLVTVRRNKVGACGLYAVRRRRIYSGTSGRRKSNITARKSQGGERGGGLSMQSRPRADVNVPGVPGQRIANNTWHTAWREGRPNPMPLQRGPDARIPRESTTGVALRLWT